MAEDLYKVGEVNRAKGQTYGDVNYDYAAYDISGINKPNIDFEVATQDYDEKNAIRLYSKSDDGLDVTIGRLIITSGRLDVPNFVKYDNTLKTYVDAALNIKSITVDGENAYSSKLQVKNINVTGDVDVLQMKDKNQALTIGGIVDAKTISSYELTKVKVGGNFAVGSTEKGEVAGVAFNNNNTTDVKGNFSLYENATCDIKVATGGSVDNWAAEVWTSNLSVDEGTWVNGTMPKVGEHPLW